MKMTEHRPYPFVGHYTTLFGLLGILESETLWATHYKFLNDSNEIERGSQYIDQAVDSTEVWKIHKANNPNAHPRECWQPLVKYSDVIELFITSFCGLKSLEDELSKDGLLSQWRGYGNKGGFCIIFDRYKLVKSYNTHAPCSTGHKAGVLAHVFEDIFYEESEDIVKNKFKMELNNVKKFIEDPARNTLLNDQIREAFKGMMVLMATLKHRGFREEQEVRFSCINRGKLNNVDLNKSNQIIYIENEAPRLKIPIDLNSITRIIIGPQLNQDIQDKKQALVNYRLERLNCQHIEVIKSTIPFIPS